MSLVLIRATRYRNKHPRHDIKGRLLCPHNKFKLGSKPCRICTPQTENLIATVIRVQKCRAKLKYQVFSHYCKETLHCQCLGCKTTYIGFLQLDHIKGNGRDHVDSNGKRLIGSTLWNWVKKNGYPKGFQVLCSNCNSLGGKGIQDRCPMEGQPH